MPAQLTPLIFKAFKDSVPGVDASMAGQIWSNMVKSDPTLVDADETDVATKIVQASKTTAQPLPQVKTQLRSPYAGTAMEARNPQNPQAELVGQFDPEQVNAAYAALQKRYEDAAPGRNAAIAMGAAGGPGVISAADTWKDLDAYNAAMTTGKQAALQAASTAGLAAGTTAQSQDQTAGAYTLDKLKGIEDLEQKRQTTQTGALTLDLMKKSNDPASPISGMVRESAIRQWSAANNGASPSAVILDRLNKMNAEELIKMAEPKFIAAWKDISAGRGAESKADIDVAVAGSMVQKPSVASTPAASTSTAPTQPTAKAPYGVISKATQDEADRESLRIINSEYAKERDPATKAALMREMLRIKKNLNDPTPVESASPTTSSTLSQEGAARLARSPISGAGQTLLPDPRIAIAEQGEGQAGVDAAARARNYDDNLRAPLAALRDQVGKNTGRGTALIARMTPTEQRTVIKLLAEANAFAGGSLPANVAGEIAKADASGQFSAGLISDLSDSALLAAIDRVEARANADRGRQRNKNTEMDSGKPAGRYDVNQPIVPLSTKPPAQVPSDKIVTVTSRAQYDALPKGTAYVDSNGVKGVK